MASYPVASAYNLVPMAELLVSRPQPVRDIMSSSYAACYGLVPGGRNDDLCRRPAKAGQ